MVVVGVGVEVGVGVGVGVVVVVGVVVGVEVGVEVGVVVVVGVEVEVVMIDWYQSALNLHLTEAPFEDWCTLIRNLLETDRAAFIDKYDPRPPLDDPQSITVRVEYRTKHNPGNENHLRQLLRSTLLSKGIRVKEDGTIEL